MQLDIDSIYIGNIEVERNCRYMICDVLFMVPLLSIAVMKGNDP